MLFALATLIPNTANAASGPTITDKATDNQDGSWTLTHSFTGTSAFNTARARAFWGCINDPLHVLLYAGNDGVLRYRKPSGESGPVSFATGRPRFPKGTIGQIPGHIVDNDGVLWTMNDTDYDTAVQPFGTKISNPQKARLQPGLSGNGCSLGLMVSDTQGGIWTNMRGYPASLTKVMTTKDGGAILQYDTSDEFGVNQLITRPNLIAEGTSFMVSDNQRHIFGFSQGTSTQTEQIKANTDVLVFEGSEYIDDTNGTSMKGARVDRNGTLTVTDAASSSGGPTFVLKGQKLNPYQYIPEFSHILYGTEGGTYEVDTYSTGKGTGIKARITPGRILRGDINAGFYLLTDRTGVLYLSGESKITSPVKFLPDSTTVNGYNADVFAIGVDYHVYQIDGIAKSVSDTGIIVDPSLHVGASGQTGPVVKYMLSDNVAAELMDAASNVKVTSSTGSTVPSGWSASFTGRNVTVTFPTDWTIPDGATYDVNVKVKPTRTGRVLAASDGTLTWNSGSATYDDLYVTGAAPLAASMPATGLLRTDGIWLAGITAGLGCATVVLRRRRGCKTVGSQRVN